MSRLRQRLAQRLSADQGLSLPELLVVLTLFSVVGAMLSTTFITVQRTVARTTQQLEDLGDARVGMDAVTRSLRTAVRLQANAAQPVLTVAQPDHVAYYANYGTDSFDGPVLVDLVVVADQLIERTVVPTLTAGVLDYSAPPRERVIVRNLADPAVFAFLGEDALTQTEVALPATVPAAQLPQIRVVQVALAAQRTTGFGVDPTAVSNRVRIRNALYVPEIP